MNLIKFTTFMSFGFLCLLFTPLQAITHKELHEYAVSQKDSDLIEILMKYGDSESDPVLHRAMNKQDYFAVFILVECGVEISSRAGMHPFQSTYDYVTKLHGTVIEKAVLENQMSLIQYFMTCKADPTIPLVYYTSYSKDIRDRKGNKLRTEVIRSDYMKTAVYDAILLNRLEVLVLFSHYGVDLHKICYEESSTNKIIKKTPLQVAIEKKNKDIVALLLSIGVKI